VDRSSISDDDMTELGLALAGNKKLTLVSKPTVLLDPTSVEQPEPMPEPNTGLWTRRPNKHERRAMRNKLAAGMKQLSDFWRVRPGLTKQVAHRIIREKTK
jgi:hypothetical protein